MAVQKAGRMFLVSRHREQPGSGRKVAKHISIIAQVIVGHSARNDGSSGVEYFLINFGTDIRPPRLRMTDEVDRGILVQDFP